MPYYAVKREKVHADGTVYISKQVRSLASQIVRNVSRFDQKTDQERFNQAYRRLYSRTYDQFHPRDTRFTHLFTLTFDRYYQDPLREYFLVKEYFETHYPDVKFTFVVGRTIQEANTNEDGFTNFHVHGLCDRYVNFSSFYDGTHSSPSAFSPDTCKKIGNTDEDYEACVFYILGHLREGYKYKRDNDIHTPKFPVGYSIGSQRYNHSITVNVQEAICDTREEAEAFLNGTSDPVEGIPASVPERTEWEEFLGDVFADEYFDPFAPVRENKQISPLMGIWKRMKRLVFGGGRIEHSWGLEAVCVTKNKRKIIITAKKKIKSILFKAHAPPFTYFFHEICYISLEQIIIIN